jgi:hypothetical protein
VKTGQVFAGLADFSDEREALFVGVDETGLEAVERLDAEVRAFFGTQAARTLRVVHVEGQLLFSATSA